MKKIIILFMAVFAMFLMVSSATAVNVCNADVYQKNYKNHKTLKLLLLEKILPLFDTLFDIIFMILEIIAEILDIIFGTDGIIKLFVLLIKYTILLIVGLFEKFSDRIYFLRNNFQDVKYTIRDLLSRLLGPGPDPDNK